MNKMKIKLSVGNKIFGGFLILIALFVVNLLITLQRGYTIDQAVSFSAEVARPSKDAINEFSLVITQSKMLITNWVYLQTNKEDRESLEKIIAHTYPQLKEKLQKLAVSWDDKDQQQKLDTVFLKFDQMIANADENIIKKLITFEDFENPLTKLLGEDVIESQIIPQSNELLERLNKIAAKQIEVSAMVDKRIKQATIGLRVSSLVLGFVIVAAGLIIAYMIVRTIRGPINYVKNVMLKLGKGELVDEDKSRKYASDEIGEMAIATNALVNGLKATSVFAESIGKGMYDSPFEPLSEHDVLGNSLIAMRNNLAKVADEDKNRNWATEGLAKFGEILRVNNTDVQKLSDEIIGNLVKYLKANQGALYLVDDDDSDEPTMSMSACYAWDKKKFINHKIHIGEGLAGQCWQEKETVFLTDVPQNYVKISSGLGDANPTCILIVPMKINDQIFGVIEIASFTTIEKNEIEFVEKIGESIASTVSSVRVNARTQHLLGESQQMTEEMRAQEEEMRQNMEELQATQEEMERNQHESQNVMEVINTSLALVEFDAEGRILKANQNFLSLVGYSATELIGEYHRMLVNREYRLSDEYKQFWRDLAEGKQIQGEFSRINKDGKTIWIKAIYSPSVNSFGEVTKIMKIAYDISDYKK
jgi:PAS domain S-box-containing protein